MRSSFFGTKKRDLKASSKVVGFLLIFIIAFSILIAPTKVAQAQLPVTDAIASAWNAGTTIWNKMQKALAVIWQKVGSIAMQQAVSKALNKIAYDTATWIGSGAEGQKPLYVTEGWDKYLWKVGDEAAGDFLESFVKTLNTNVSDDCGETQNKCNATCTADFKKTGDQNQLSKCADACTKGWDRCSKSVAKVTKNCRDANTNCYDKCQEAGPPDPACLSSCDEVLSKCIKGLSGTDSNTQSLSSYSASFNVCQPSSIEAKLRIGLGLVDQTRPQGPNCTASEMVKSWGEAISDSGKFVDWQDPNFLDTFSNIFDPRANDLGIYMTARTDLSSAVIDTRENEKVDLTANKGWKGLTDIAGKLKGTPGDAENARQTAQNLQTQSFGKVTGDIMVDTANVFLNQLALTYYQKVMRDLSNSAKKANTASETANGTMKVGSYEGDSISYGEGTLKQSLSNFLKPNFGTRADYDILSDLATCVDPKNPGPTNCVIDDKFLQGISEKKTVIEAINEGYLNKNWQLTADIIQGSEGSYSLRNLSILRKYRILPVGWEVAAKKISATEGLKATLMDLVSCFDPTDKYTEFSSGFERNNQAWCQGLVDPNWVLKAPQNYCQKLGIGAQILGTPNVLPGTPSANGTAGTLSTLSITRGEEYCADDKSCIKEKDDGSCEAYGYCNEEKRIWDFNGESCEPLYNTCQSFINPSDGQAVAYLENTLDYGQCNADSAGCRQYALSGAYNTLTGAVAWNSLMSRYFNKYLSACREEDEGCSEFLRLKPTWGANLVMNSDFGADTINNNFEKVEAGQAGEWFKLNSWPIFGLGPENATYKASIVDAAAPQENLGVSGKVLKLELTGGDNTSQLAVFSDHNNPLLPNDLQIIPGYSYTLSADVYLVAGDKVRLSLGSEAVYQEVTEKDTWQHVSVTRQPGGDFNDPAFAIKGYAAAAGTEIIFYVKNIKLEIGEWDTGYSIYGSFKTYEKILPPYLEEACYNNSSGAVKDYTLKSDAPEVCSRFARRCNKEEVGCDLYSGVKDVFAVPAKVTSGDYCSQDCLGYDVYITKESYFNSSQAENLIPEKSQTCQAEAAGCNAFTNLDSLAQGGEQLEYYTSLKQCIKPGPTCGQFYAWEGTDSGYQLKVYSLEKNGGINEPKIVGIAQESCTEDIFKKPVSDPAYNPDCLQFYNTEGIVFYHSLSRTVTCSENCHPYRMGENNIDRNITQDGLCGGLNKHWDDEKQVCFFCLNGGIWDDNYGSCVYQAIPGEGKTCAPAENGCREYNGNNGSNVRLLASYDFESGLSGWFSNCTNGVVIETISNSKDGHSLKYNDGLGAAACKGLGEVGDEEAPIVRRPLIERVLANGDEAAQLKVGNGVKEGGAYSIKFLARAENDTVVNIYFMNPAKSGEKAQFNSVSITGGNQWGIYQANLGSLDHPVVADELLMITANGDFYFDNLVLTEITDRYYLIKNTSQIPNVCYYDIFDKYQGADYNLGCSQYTDRGNLTHNLRKFSGLCSDSSVGCEQLISTQNYTPSGAGIWGDTTPDGICSASEPDCVSVPGDQAIYAVFDSTKQCNSADLGCSRLGQSQNSGSGLDWSDVFQKNNPNLYDQTLCGSGEAGCESWSSADSNEISYFKNPGNNTCSYRESNDLTNPGKAWYKIAVKRCDFDGNEKIDGNELGTAICVNSDDCGGSSCITDNNDYLCPVSYFKTIGLGGSGNQIPVPNGAAGLCPAESSGCTEYLDPVSKFSPNLVYNPQMLNNAEGWLYLNPAPQVYQYSQTIKLDPNKLYSFTVKTANGYSPDVVLNFDNLARPLLNNNTFGEAKYSFTNTNISPYGPIFNTLSNLEVEIKFTVSRQITNSGGPVVEIRPLVIDYQNKNNIDKTSCNGQTSFDNGCVLFNERSVSGGQGLASLNWDAYKTLDGQGPITCTDSCTANQLIKARPDRVCAKWFDCLTYIQDPTTNEKTCYAIGECDRLNDKNECANFLSDDKLSKLNSFSSEKDKNSSGYALIDKYYFSQMQEVGINAEANFDFEDSAPALYCQKAGTNTACDFSKGKSILTETLVREPDSALIKGVSDIKYPAQGKNFLKVAASYEIIPHSKSVIIPVIKDTDYYLNYLVNTKGTGLTAKVKINFLKNDGTIISSALDPEVVANSGWERKIFKFHTPNDVALKGIQIVLGSTITDQGGAVYFDDLHIEPVLWVGDNKFVSKECRLYPTADSLTCTNKNSNVIKDGLEGYCLEHDVNNPDVCLLWYPIDKISSSKINRSSLGYQGKFPLNYCTEVSGDFLPVEKRESYLAAYNGCRDGSCNNLEYAWCFSKTSTAGSKDSEAFQETGGDFYCWGDANNNKDDTITQSVAVVNAICGDDGDYYVARKSVGFGSHCAYVYICIPTYTTWGDTRQYVLWQPYSQYNKPATLPSEGICGWTWTEVDLQNANSELDYSKFYTAWYPYDGLSSRQAGDAIFPPGSPKKVDLDCQSTKDSHCYTHNEKDNATPPVRIYDYSNPPVDEEALKLITDTNSENVFNLTCNRFIQTVDSNGINMAWAGRTNAATAEDTVNTPAYFVDLLADPYKYFGSDESHPPFTEHYIAKYGRNREDSPFGAAVWPEDFDLLSSQKIKFRDQYSEKNNEEIFAGRPYGCVTGDGVLAGYTGCNYIGYCSLDPSVYCVYSGVNDPNFNLNSLSCGKGGYGTCLPLWQSDNYLRKGIDGSDEDHKNILKTLFLKSYNGYLYNDALKTYLPASNQIIDMYDFSDDSVNLNFCLNGSRPVNNYEENPIISDSFCSVYPQVSNVKLFYNNDQISEVVGGLDLKSKGIYRLTFNSLIDKEQQPLKVIYIDWGDGQAQIITGQDHHPDLNNPHIIYHYYQEVDVMPIKIFVYDNWNTWGCKTFEGPCVNFVPF